MFVGRVGDLRASGRDKLDLPIPVKRLFGTVECLNAQLEPGMLVVSPLLQ